MPRRHRKRRPRDDVPERIGTLVSTERVYESVIAQKIWRIWRLLFGLDDNLFSGVRPPSRAMYSNAAMAGQSSERDAEKRGAFLHCGHAAQNFVRGRLREMPGPRRPSVPGQNPARTQRSMDPFAQSSSSTTTSS
jgi:hypothetical protein